MVRVPWLTPSATGGVNVSTPTMGDDRAMTQTPEHEPTAQPTGGQPVEPVERPAEPSRRDRHEADPLASSRTSGFYAAVVALGVVLVLLVIFIVQNTERQDVQFLWLEGRAPLAVLLLIATAAGIFLTATGASLRLLQVRRRVKRERKARR